MFSMNMMELSKMTDSPLMNEAKNMDKITDMVDLDKPIVKELKEVKGCPIDGNGGTWTGERGDSEWKPDDNEIPTRYNPDGLSWKEIKEKYGFETIPFNDGEPDFSEVPKGEVKIDDFSSSRTKNFSQADEKLAEQRGCTPEEVKKWREENKYTWHECSDCNTMQKVPSEVHGNVSHTGGISETKSKENTSNV